MKYALLSDVHANLPALDAVLGAIARSNDVGATYRRDCHTWLVSTLMEKRTQRGHSGQSTDRAAAGGSKLLRG